MALVITYLSGEKKTLVWLIGFGESGKGGDIYGVKAVSSRVVKLRDEGCGFRFRWAELCCCIRFSSGLLPNKPKRSGRSNGQRCLVSGCWVKVQIIDVCRVVGRRVSYRSVQIGIHWGFKRWAEVSSSLSWGLQSKEKRIKGYADQIRQTRKNARLSCVLIVLCLID